MCPPWGSGECRRPTGHSGCSPGHFPVLADGGAADNFDHVLFGLGVLRFSDLVQMTDHTAKCLRNGILRLLRMVQNGVGDVVHWFFVDLIEGLQLFLG